MHGLQRGFNIIEVLISLAVLAILVTLAAPSFTQWLQNQQIRTATDSILNGLQVARSEAVARNTNVSFQFMDGLSSTCAVSALGSGGILLNQNWVVSVGDPSGACDKKIGDTPPGPVIQSRSESEGTPNTAATTTPGGATTVTFTPLGATTGNPDGSFSLQRVDVTNLVSAGAARPLRVVINPGGSLRMCDPIAVAPDSRACP
jgi:type IV fimbrial biogenesis protein FimT